MPCLLVLGVLAGLILKEPDLGTALMVGIVCFVMCYAAGVRLVHLGIVSCPMLLGVICMLIFTPFRMRRLITFLDPWADPQGDCVYGPNDIPLSGVTIDLRNAQGVIIATTTTDQQGNYEFDDLAPGEYQVFEHQPAGYLQGMANVGTEGNSACSV